MVTSIITRSLFALILVGGVAFDSASQPRLQIHWPNQWEYRPPVERNSVLHLRARQHRYDASVQQLNISVVGTRGATQLIDSQSIRGLMEKLRDATLRTTREGSIDILPLGSSQGYYFVSTDRHYRSASGNGFRQLVEGVVVRSGYLINFTLFTHDAGSADSKEIISALAELRID